MLINKSLFLKERVAQDLKFKILSICLFDQIQIETIQFMLWKNQ
jgi:hypothetical protein